LIAVVRVIRPRDVTAAGFEPLGFVGTGGVPASSRSAGPGAMRWLVERRARSRRRVKFAILLPGRRAHNPHGGRFAALTDARTGKAAPLCHDSFPQKIEKSRGATGAGIVRSDGGPLNAIVVGFSAAHRRFRARIRGDQFQAIYCFTLEKLWPCLRIVGKPSEKRSQRVYLTDATRRCARKKAGGGNVTSRSFAAESDEGHFGCNQRRRIWHAVGCGVFTGANGRRNVSAG